MFNMQLSGLVLAVALLSASVFALSHEDQEWSVYKLKYGKVYRPSEDIIRRSLYKEVKADVERHNAEFHNGEHLYHREINKFSDWLPYETDKLRGFKMPEGYQRKGASYIPPGDDINIPTSMDWRIKGAVTPVKDQLMCGSCWAFATTGSLEGQHFRQTGELVSLSEQQLVDCDRETDEGCEGGMMDNAYDYIKQNNGLDTEISYPYMGEDGTCHFQNKTVGATDVGYQSIPEYDEEALLKAVATVGPVSIAFNARRPDFMDYSGGIYDPPQCKPTFLDHGVLVVGYGVSTEGTTYWIIKNSWGTDWGEQGYFRMLRGVNMCGVATHAVFPLV